MLAKQSDWVQPQFFHQKGWIASKFQVKNLTNAPFRWKKRTPTDTPHHQSSHHQSSSQHQPIHISQTNKPATAPQKHRSKLQITQNFQQLGVANYKWEDHPPVNDSRYSNFRTTLGNRKQLLYIKPYTRYQNHSLTIDQKKTQIYKEINNPDVNNFIDSFPNHSKFIQYLTQYREPFSSRQAREISPTKTAKPRHRTSFNVLKNKLKRKCEPSHYQSKINAIKFQ